MRCQEQEGGHQKEAILSELATCPQSMIGARGTPGGWALFPRPSKAGRGRAREGEEEPHAGGSVGMRTEGHTHAHKWGEAGVRVD